MYSLRQRPQTCDELGKAEYPVAGRNVGCKITLKQKVPRLLLPRQGERDGFRRQAKHLCSMHTPSIGYDEDDTGSWNALRHRLMR